MNKEDEMQGEECLAQMLLDDLGDGPMYESNIKVLAALGKLIREAKKSKLTVESKEEFVKRARGISEGYPHDFEHIAYLLDNLDKSLPPASLIRINAARRALLSDEEVLAEYRQEAIEYQKECERYKNGKSV